MGGFGVGSEVGLLYHLTWYKQCCDTWSSDIMSLSEIQEK